MPEPIFIMTFENGECPASPAFLIPVSLIEAHVAPFVISRRETDLRTVELQLVYANGESVELSYDLQDDNPARATMVTLTGYAHDPALPDALVAILCSANAVIIQTGGDRPIIGRAATAAHLPADLIESLGPPHQATCAEDLWSGADVATPRVDTVAALQTEHWHALQSEDQTVQRFFLHMGMAAMRLDDIIRQATREHEPPESLAQMRVQQALLATAQDAAADPQAADFLHRVRAACADLRAFNFATRINTGQIVTRFARTLRDEAPFLNRTTELLVDMEHNADAAAQRASALARSGLATQLPAPTARPSVASMNDAALMAAGKKQADATQSLRRSFWSEVKSMTDNLGEEIKSWRGAAPVSQPETRALHALLVTLRQAARADDRPDWRVPVASALSAAVAYDVVARVLARHSACPFDASLSHIGYRLRQWFPEQLEAIRVAETWQHDWAAEVERRGLDEARSGPALA